MGMISARSMASDPIAALLSASYGRSERGEGVAPAWLGPVQEQARASFLACGLPTKLDDNWRYTDLKRIRESAFRLVTMDDVQIPVILPERLTPETRAAIRLVFVNGGFRADLSVIPAGGSGITVQSLATALTQDVLTEPIVGGFQAGEALGSAPLVALNTALFDDGFVFVVDPHRAETVWIEAIFIGGSQEPVAFAPRHVVSIGEGSRIALIEQYVSLPGATYFAVPVLQVDVKARATFYQYRCIECDAMANNAMMTAVSLGEGATFEGFSLIAGRGLNRLETRVTLNGRGAACRMGCAYHAAGDDICDNTTLVEHLAPKTKSRQVFRGVIDDVARAVFQGRVIVNREADEADGHQLSKALLLSDTAEINQKPALEIFADNVKCSHGAVAGSLDQIALFYLRSRGMPERVARRLLIEGFMAEALYEVSIEDVRAALQARAAAAQTKRQVHS